MHYDLTVHPILIWSVKVSLDREPHHEPGESGPQSKTEAIKFIDERILKTYLAVYLNCTVKDERYLLNFLI